MGNKNKPEAYQIVQEPIRSTWRRALKSNNVFVVRELMDKKNLPGTLSVAPYNSDPITYIINKGNVCDLNAVHMIQLLSRRGAELNVPNYKSTVPADHALLCQNSNVAYTVVYETFRLGLEKNLRVPYTPRFDRLLATTVGDARRAEKVGNLKRNIKRITEELWVQIYNGDPRHTKICDNALTVIENIDLDDPLRIVYKNQPSVELKKAHRDYKKLQFDPGLQTKISDLAQKGEDVRFEEWSCCREM